MNRKQKIRALIELCGGNKDVAKKFGVTRQTVTYWGTHGIPASHAQELSRMSDGKFSTDEILSEMGSK